MTKVYYSMYDNSIILCEDTNYPGYKYKIVLSETFNFMTEKDKWLKDTKSFVYLGEL